MTVHKVCTLQATSQCTGSHVDPVRFSQSYSFSVEFEVGPQLTAFLLLFVYMLIFEGKFAHS